MQEPRDGHKNHCLKCGAHHKHNTHIGQEEEIKDYSIQVGKLSGNLQGNRTERKPPHTGAGLQPDHTSGGYAALEKHYGQASNVTDSGGRRTHSDVLTNSVWVCAEQ